MSDLLVAESMHQAVLGNSERAGAALSAIDRQSVAPAPSVVRTPRTGRGYSQRVVVLLGDGPAPTGLAGRRAWAGRAAARRWIGRLLGSPGADPDRRAGRGAPARRWRYAVADLGLSPLALVLAAEDGSGGQASELARTARPDRVARAAARPRTRP